MKDYFFVPSSEKEGADMFMLNGFLFGFNFKNTGPAVQLIVESLPVTGQVMGRFTDVGEFLN